MVGLLDGVDRRRAPDRAPLRGRTTKAAACALATYHLPSARGGQPGSAAIYDALDLTSSERHRHRYEVNITLPQPVRGQAGLRFSGLSPDGELPEIVEIEDHPWFIGVQFHPELRSKPLRPPPALQVLRGGCRDAVAAGLTARGSL